MAAAAEGVRGEKKKPGNYTCDERLFYLYGRESDAIQMKG